MWSGPIKCLSPQFEKFCIQNIVTIISAFVSLVGHNLKTPSGLLIGKLFSSYPEQCKNAKKKTFIFLQSKQGRVQIYKPTCNVDLLGVGSDRCGSDCAVGEVSSRAIVDVLYLGLQLAEPQHDVIQQHSQGLLKVCERASIGGVLCLSRQEIFLCTLCLHTSLSVAN